jgi:cysteine synthase A
MSHDLVPESGSILTCVGNTPLRPLGRLFPDSTVYAKLEMFNPTGSAKDRAGLSMVRDAIEQKRVRPGGTVIESSSGNMGLAVAQACLYYGLRFICVVDERTSARAIELLRVYQADVELVDCNTSSRDNLLEARLLRVEELRQKFPDLYWTDQYSNPANSRAHWTTMKEIVDELGRSPDYLYVATSTCGTLAGCVQYTRNRGLKTTFVAVDAWGSVTFDGEPGIRRLPGHGISVMPKLYKRDLADRVYRSTERQCVNGCLRLRDKEAIIAGASSGAVISAVMDHVTQEQLPHDACVVAILHDRGDRYLDTIYSPEWVAQLER